MFFLELFCFFHDPEVVGNLISGSSAFSKSSLNIWKFIVHILLKPGLENFEHYFASVWDECNCAVVWAFFDIAFLWDLNENWPFPGSPSEANITSILIEQVLIASLCFVNWWWVTLLWQSHFFWLMMVGKLIRLNCILLIWSFNIQKLHHFP